MKKLLAAIGLIILAFVVCVILWIAGGFIGLWWYPYSIQRQTAIVRSSNSYISAHQQEIISLMIGLSSVQSEQQKQAIITQVCEQASLIPGYVPQAATNLIQGQCP